MNTEKRIWWHWQNLTADYGKRQMLPINGRAWLHLWAWKLHVEWHLWSRACRLGVDLAGKVGCDDDTILLGVALPPLCFYLGIEAPTNSRLWHLMPEYSRECKIAVHDWAVWINPWSRQHEWHRDDPWYVRGLTFHIDDFILGKRKCTTEEIRWPERVAIELDGRVYQGIATYERRTWKRSRWFAFSKESTWIDMDLHDGLPHDGKGENGWDCGGDALCGWGCNGIDLEKCIASGIEKVLKARKRYGNSCMEQPA